MDNMECRICGRKADFWKSGEGWLLEDYRYDVGIMATCPECQREPVIVIDEEGNAKRSGIPVRVGVVRDPDGIY